MQIAKRSGQVVPFDIGKIEGAIQKALDAVGESEEGLANLLAGVVWEILPGGLVTVETVQDYVELTLMDHQQYEAAKAYILYRDKRQRARERAGQYDSAERLLRQRYYANADETWPELCYRVASYVAGSNHSLRKRAYNDMLNKRWLPNSPAIVNAGRPNGGLMACFVAGVEEDSIEGHMETLTDIAQVAKAGGGCGFTGTPIRKKGAPVAGSAHGYAYGPNAYAKQVDGYMSMMTQGAAFRRMALMYTMSSDHDDIDDFIDLKSDGEDTGFNQSLFASDDWMQKATENPDSKQAAQFEKLASNAWSSGEPGLIFASTVNSNTPYTEEIYATNPCGEQPLPPYGSCNLGSINLANDNFYSDTNLFQFGKLEKTTRNLAEFLDSIGSKNKFPNSKFEQWYEDNRPIGIGVMGYADALLRQGIAYGSEEALAFLEQALESIYSAANKMSGYLGAKLGVPKQCRAEKRRNKTLLTIAPTGSIAIIAGCSHSIEPVFSPAYNRTDERGESYLFEHPERYAEYFRSAINTDLSKVVTWKEHLDTQIAAQKYVDAAVSKTVNLPHYATVQDVKKIFEYAWRNECKGITVYRDGSRNTQVLEQLTEEDEAKQDCPTGVCSI